jgi:photosystem II stability/assembly factor-like uncharacterized protein
MRQFTILILLLFCSYSSLWAQHTQWLKTQPPITNDTPYWASLMYGERPNISTVDSAYQAYYTEHAFEKNTHTQNYKHWRPKVEPYIRKDGYLQWPSAAELRQEEQQYQRSLQQLTQKQASPWVNLGPYETLNQGDGQFEVSWQANVYTIDQADSDPAVLYCGTESGGVFRSDDSGQHWAHISANTMMNNVRIVRVDPNDATTVYAGDWNRLYRSTDSGASWEILLDAADESANALGINAIAVNPADDQQLIVAGEAGLWRSEDGGQNWSYLFSNPVYDVEFQPTEPSTLYLVRGHATEERCEFLKSIDSGATWEVKSTGWYAPDLNAEELSDGGAKIAVSALDPNVVLAGLIGNSKPGDDGYIGLWKSEDAGESWTLLGPHPGGPYEYSGGPATHKNIMINEGGGGPYQGFYDYVLAISPFDINTVYIGGVSLYKSTDGGATFNVIGGYQGNTWIHPDMQEITVGPDGVWLATDGGIDFTADEFTTVESRKYGLTASEFWGFGSAWNEDLLVGGRYHNGNTAIRPEYGNGQSMRLGGAEAPTGYVQPGGRNLAYFSDIATQLVPTDLSEAAQQFPRLQLYPSESYFSTHSSELDFAPHCYNHIYLGRDHQLWKSQDGGLSFELLATFGDGGQPLMQFEIPRSNPNVLYVYQRVGWSTAVLWKSEDGGTNWQSLDFPNGPSSMRAGGLAVNPENEDEIWVYFAHQNNDGNKIYRSLNGGLSWENMTASILDGHRIHTLLYQAGTDGVVYAGTDKAVFYRTESEDWQLYNEGLPMRTNANLFRPFYKENKLRLGTYSNGVWEAPLVQASRPIAQPTVDKMAAGCSRDTFYFDDYSVLAHEGASWSWSFEPEPAYVSATDVRNPKVVFGETGEYLATLTITDAQGQSSTRSLPTVLMVADCRVDTLPGFAMQCVASGDYATVESLPAEGQSWTITAWIKPEGVQPDYTGIAITGSGPTAGFNFRPNMELGYHWPGGAWWWSSGLTVPADEWSYVAMVVHPEGITLYLNEAQATHSITPESIDLSSTALFLGSYRGWQSRNFSGLMDEVKIYDRALSTEEIRLNRHLTVDPAGEEGLLAYYQFNENGGSVLNKVGVAHAVLNGNAARTLSLAPVGSGNSTAQVLNGGGVYTFGETGLQFTLENANTTEEVLVVSRLNVPPSTRPADEVLPSSGYWIVNYYGASDWAANLSQAIFGGFPLPSEAAQLPDAFRMRYRPQHAEMEEWLPIGVADSAETGAEGQLYFGNDGIWPNSGQFIIEQGSLVSTSSWLLPTDFAVYPNPIRQGTPLTVAYEGQSAFDFELYDAAGKRILQRQVNGQAELQSQNWPAGSYTYRMQTEKEMKMGRLVVVD